MSTDIGRRPAWGHYALLVAQLALATWVIARFQIESRAFGRLSLLVLAGYVVHTLLPGRFRAAFFALISMAGIGLALGWINASWVLAVGCGLIVIAYLPIAWSLRIGLMCVTAAGLALLRLDVLHAPFSGALWPVLGSMFMFRMIIYLYDRTHGVSRGSIWQTLSYFFMLPNVCFALFPVVDYKTFRRSYESEEAWRCHQVGVEWITRGIVQLLLYRLVYYYAVLAPTEVESAFDLARYVLSNYALYLRVSGAFHLVIGIVRLFGWALPETNFLYYLASSVNDFWRRANIYWKDFMTKIFYFPAYFRLRRLGEVRALMLSTLIVVVATWSLHSYQWFWLRGDFPVRWQDGVFWTALGTAMLINTLYENRHTKARGRRASLDASSAGEALRRALATVVVFTLISVLWSLWTCESFDDWLAMWSAVTKGEAGPALALLVGVFGALMLGSVFAERGLLNRDRTTSQRAARTAITLVALLLLSTSAVYSRLGDQASSIVQSLRVAKLNRLDAEKLQKGYYENLLDVDQFNTELWSVLKSRPTGWRELRETSALRVSEDFLLSELTPGTRMTYKGAVLEVSSAGLRDGEYETAKPAGTVRGVLTGGSLVMGSGVSNEETFEAIVERRLDGELSTRGVGGFELLNLAVGGYSPLQRLRSLEVKGLPFSPDLAIYVAHENEIYRINRHLVAARRRGVEVPYPDLRRLLERAGADASMADEVFERRLEPYAEEILDFVYRRFVDVSREAGAVPIWVFLPSLEIRGDAEDIEWMFDMAREAGFEVINLAGLWEGRDLFTLRVADWDYHPNVRGHALIADRLHEALLERPALFDIAREGGSAP